MLNLLKGWQEVGWVIAVLLRWLNCSKSKAIRNVPTILVRDIVDSGSSLEAAVLVGHLPRTVSADSNFSCGRAGGEGGQVKWGLTEQHPHCTSIWKDGKDVCSAIKSTDRHPAAVPTKTNVLHLNIQTPTRQTTETDIIGNQYQREANIIYKWKTNNTQPETWKEQQQCPPTSNQTSSSKWIVAPTYATFFLYDQYHPSQISATRTILLQYHPGKASYYGSYWVHPVILEISCM